MAKFTVQIYLLYIYYMLLISVQNYWHLAILICQQIQTHLAFVIKMFRILMIVYKNKFIPIKHKHEHLKTLNIWWGTLIIDVSFHFKDIAVIKQNNIRNF